MSFHRSLLRFSVIFALLLGCWADAVQQPLLRRPQPSRNRTSLISQDLFWELEQLARIVDISYCVGTAGLGIQNPFVCASRCADVDFESFELVTAWNTGPFLSDSCGYIALSHTPDNPRLILAFRGTYSLANTIADLSSLPQPYVPYPAGGHGDGEDETSSDLWPSTNIVEPHQYPSVSLPTCTNCTVHGGFYSSWLHARKLILPHVAKALEKYPSYKLVLVGHSLGGAVATLAGLEFHARGWDAHVTTFGEPRLGNQALNAYINTRFNITAHRASNKLHRVTHVGDPVPLLPLAEWGYSMHSEEIHIAESNLPASIADIYHCVGDDDDNCIAGNGNGKSDWGVPTRFQFWQLIFAHRDYFWRLGLCVPGGDQSHKYALYDGDDDDNNT